MNALKSVWFCVFVCLSGSSCHSAPLTIIPPSKSYPSNIYIKGTYKMEGSVNIPKDEQFTISQIDGRAVYIHRVAKTKTNKFENNEPTDKLVNAIEKNEYYWDRGRAIIVLNTIEDQSPHSNDLIVLKSPSSGSELSQSLDTLAPVDLLGYLYRGINVTVDNIIGKADPVEQSEHKAVYKLEKAVVTFETDQYNRLIAIKGTSAGQGYPTQQTIVRYLPGDQTLPAYFEMTGYSRETSGAVLTKAVCQFDEVCFDPQIIKEKILPQPVNVGATLEDDRLNPPVRFELKSSTLPTDEEISAIAAKKKVERDTESRKRAEQAARSAVANDPHNMKDVPVTGESWGNRLRRVPNWAYGGAVMLFLGGWVVAASRRRKK